MNGGERERHWHVGQHMSEKRGEGKKCISHRVQLVNTIFP